MRRGLNCDSMHPCEFSGCFLRSSKFLDITDRQYFSSSDRTNLPSFFEHQQRTVLILFPGQKDSQELSRRDRTTTLAPKLKNISDRPANPDLPQKEQLHESSNSHKGGSFPTRNSQVIPSLSVSSLHASGIYERASISSMLNTRRRS